MEFVYSLLEVMGIRPGLLFDHIVALFAFESAMLLNPSTKDFYKLWIELRTRAAI